MANNMSTIDFSFKMDRTGKPVTTKGAQHIRTVVMMLFAMEPGTDEYEPERGLDLLGRKQRTYIEMTRDTEYESMIHEQFTKYTDLTPLNVLAVYLNNSLFVSLTVQFLGEVYTMELSSELGADLDSLTAMLVNVNDFNSR